MLHVLYNNGKFYSIILQIMWLYKRPYCVEIFKNKKNNVIHNSRGERADQERIFKIKNKYHTQEHIVN